MIKYLQCILLLTSIASAVTSLPQDSLKTWLSSSAPFDFVLIDVRGPSELTQIIGNENCKPYNLVWSTQFISQCTTLTKDQHIIIYCRSGSRASSATAYIESLGYANIYNAGGMLTWNGPALTGADTLASSSLPEPSMKISNTAVHLYVTPENRAHSNTNSAVYTFDYKQLYNTISPVFSLTGQKISMGKQHSKKISAALYIRLKK